MKASVILALSPILALAQPGKLAIRQDAPIDVPEGPLPLCTSHCFGRWGWPITLCTGQEGLNHLIECFYEECEDEPRRIHAQLAAEQNCEEGMGWPTRMPEDLEIESAGPADDDEEPPTESASASSSAGSGQPTSTPAPTSSAPSATASGPNTGAFDVEGASSTVSSAVASATESPNGARQTAFAGYAGVAAAALGVYAAL